MPKTSKKNKRHEKNLRMQATFMGIRGASKMSARNLVQEMRDITGPKTFLQYVIANRLGSDWDNYQEQMGKSDRRAARQDKDRARGLQAVGKPLTRDEWNDSLETQERFAQ